jgi:hypothetical protein
LIDATPLESASHDPSLQYHEITAEARMSEPPGDIPILDISDSENIDEDLACLGLRRADKDDFFSDLDKQWKEQAWERYAALSKPPKPSKPPKRRIRTLVEQVEKATGKTVQAVTLPNVLRTAAEAARKLHCSIKTLNGYVASGALRYVIIGHGTKRPRRMFTDADLDDLIANQTRKDVPCPSTSPKTAARHTGTSTSKCEVIGFTARRNARRAAKPKK